jgi:hypothetical protein
MNINTVVRVRPLPRDYEGSTTLTVMDESSVALCAPPPDAGQRDYKGDSLAVQDKVELSEQDKCEHCTSRSRMSPFPASGTCGHHC